MLKSTESQLTEVGTVDVERSFAAEETSTRGGGKLAGIGFKAVFEDEPDLQAVAEIFGPFDADARPLGDAGRKSQGVVGFRSVVGIGTNVGQTFVDDAVDLHFGRAGGSCTEPGQEHRSEFELKGGRLHKIIRGLVDPSPLVSH